MQLIEIIIYYILYYMEKAGFFIPIIDINHFISEEYVKTTVWVFLFFIMFVYFLILLPTFLI